MGIKRLLAVLALSVLALMSSACGSWEACVSEPGPDDPFLIGGVIRIKRGVNTVGFVSVDDENRMWFLLRNEEGFPLALSSGSPVLRFIHESNSKLSWEDLCATYGSGLGTDPKVIQVYAINEGEWICPAP
jgi:hypothetical protein